MRSKEYLAGVNGADPKISSVFADLNGLPPLLIQSGGNEILLSDSTRVAARAAFDGVNVTLEVTAGVPHVFPAFAMMLEEGATALDHGAAFIKDHIK